MYMICGMKNGCFLFAPKEDNTTENISVDISGDGSWGWGLGVGVGVRGWGLVGGGPDLTSL